MKEHSFQCLFQPWLQAAASHGKPPTDGSHLPTGHEKHTSPDGGIGRRAGLKHQWSNPCRFDPGSGYQKSQIFDFQGFAIFLFGFCSTVAPPNGLFWGHSAYFYFLSTKTYRKLNRPTKGAHIILQTLSIKTAIFMDSKHLCTKSQGIW